MELTPIQRAILAKLAQFDHPLTMNDLIASTHTGRIRVLAGNGLIKVDITITDKGKAALGMPGLGPIRQPRTHKVELKPKKPRRAALIDLARAYNGKAA